jgi:hypothetical protein
MRQHLLTGPGQPPLPLPGDLRLNVPARSRGTSMLTWPVLSVSTVLPARQIAIRSSK